MASPWLAWPPGADPARLSRRVHLAHERFLTTGEPDPTVRDVVVNSWRRSVGSGVDPDRLSPGIELCTDALDEYRLVHPLAAALPTIRRLLVEEAASDGLIVAVGDGDGRLLWVEGDHRMRSRAENMSFVAGANWGEESAGTNAPGTALATGHPLQIFAAEHFSRIVQPWSCTAAPIHDPDAGHVLGVLDITGGGQAASPQMLTVVRATVAAVEAELRLQRITEHAAGWTGAGASGGRADGASHGQGELTRLVVLGREQGLFIRDERHIELSPRHTELLLLLALEPSGMTAEELAAALHERECSPVTIRAEMTRLRRILGRDLISSRPYRLTESVRSDACLVGDLVDEGDCVRALATYPGPLLPRSRAPRIIEYREELHHLLRSALLAQGTGEALLRYAQRREVADDLEVWRACRDRLPERSPLRARASGQVRRLDRALAS